MCTPTDKPMTHPCFLTILFRAICAALAFVLPAVCGDVLCAGKTPVGLCGRVYLCSGDTIAADGDTRIGVPSKSKKLEIIEHAYTKAAKVSRRIATEEVDSVVLWTTTAPERPRTFRFVKDYGWCWRLEWNSWLTVYCHSPKGYYFAGNGGLWLRGKGSILVLKDGRTYNLGRYDKKLSAKARRQAMELVADDAALSAYLNSAHGRADKVLRSLGKYNHDK